ncbi:MAG: hypothetical protein JWQ02_3182 [Capsulimonas sp.]|nr:hypothetical protein [Capsulimonas sp.]
MKHAFWPAMAAMTAIVAISAVHAAPGDDRVMGQVSAVDAAAKTITVTSRNFRDPQAEPTTTTFKVTDATKYTVEATKTLDSLKVGDNIRVGGRPDDSGNVEARSITVVPAGQGGPGAGRPGGAGGPGAGAPGGAGGPGGRGGRRGGTMGVIATLKPALTITTADGKTITVTTTADTRITGPAAGSWSDVKTDSFVSAEVTGDAGSQVATTVRVMNGMGFGRGGGQGGPGGQGAPGGQGGRRRGGGQGGPAPAPVQ